MDEKISLEAIAVYGDAYAEKLLKNFFASKEKINGQEILSLSSIQQVNLFVIRELFKAWKEETRKQKSAYFDNENPEVKEALATYMSVVSNHILIDRAHFSPLLKKAVSQTLMAIFDPYDFFSMLVTGKDNKLEVASLRDEIKYIKINKAPIERMLQTLEQRKVEHIPGNEAFAILDQILEEVNFTPEDLDGYIEKFSQVHYLDPASFYISKPAHEVEVRATNTPKAEVRSEMSETRTTYSEDRVVVEQKKVVVQEVKPTINERTPSGKQALMDNLKKISKIKDSLSINQKFMFTKVLFFGDFESFSRAIDEIDQLPDLNAALRYLERHSSNWDRDSKEFHEFMEMVEQRFA
ncbi:MAG TPA: hypothetical protein VGD40_15335 [Chryseosolibacter sp.]